MADVQGWTPVAEPSGWTPVAPDFKTQNAKDAEGNAEVDPNTVGTFIRHLWETVNPAQLGQLLAFPKAAGGSGMDHPLAVDGSQQYAPNFLKQMHAVKREADAAWDKGDKVTATAKYIESVLPIIGPWMSHQGNQLQQGKYAAAAGDMLGFTANAAAPAVVSALTPERAAATSAARSTLTAPEQASNAFAAEHDIPLDAATATGSRFVRGAQKVAGESLLGAPTAERAQLGQTEALTRAGRQIADDVHPQAVSPEQAGQGITDSMTGLVRDLHADANKEYAKLRAFEEDPKYASDVPKAQSGAQVEALRLEQRRTLGRVPTEPELRELRRIQAELNNYGYEGHTWNSTDDFTAAGRRTSGAGGKYDIVGGHGGAPVYHDIVGSMEGAPTRSQLQAQITQALETGSYRTEGAKNAIEVAGRRLEGDRSVSHPILPPEAGDTVSRTETMGLAVDVRPVKQALQPLYQSLKREAELVPLMGDKARALTALDRLVNGPNHAPLSVADAALSDLKSMARVDEPALRSVGEGQAAAAVKALDAAVRARATAAGPEVINALEFGRAATKGKYQVADVLDNIKTEPVQAFRQMTAPKDAGVALLRRVQDVAPARMPEIGRAKLEEMLDAATERGRFDHADRLFADWQKLGPETKRILYGSDAAGAARITALDNFFLLAKRLSENPNPSGTAPTLLKGGEMIGLATHPLATLPASLTMGALAKLLYTPRGVAALTKLMKLETPSLVKSGAGTVGAAVKQAAWIDLATAARAAGAPFDLPKAADRQAER